MLSFGKATRGSFLQGSELPGPGNYKSNGGNGGLSYSIGRSTRSSSKPSTAPGPGQYQANMGKRKGITIAQKTSYGSVMNTLGNNGGNPGPGQYQSSSNDCKAPAYTFGLKTGSTLDSSKAMGLPGPGQYNPSCMSSKGGLASGFGTSKRGVGGNSQSMNALPGPGQYTVDRGSLVGPKVGFGTSCRGKGGAQNGESLPGPGQYAFEDPMGKSGPKASMKFRPQTATLYKTIEAPGPGQYNPDICNVKGHTPGGRIGSAKRDGLSQRGTRDTPGPGHFNANNDDWTKKSKNPGFGASNRYNVACSKEGPGPGNYNLSEGVHATAPSYSMGSGAARSKGGKNEQPGPGQYNPRLDYAKENLGGVKIGTSPRGGKHLGDGPGPGNYNVTGRLGGPAYGIGLGGRSQGKPDATPGPGHYKLPYYVAEVPKYTMPDKPECLRYV